MSLTLTKGKYPPIARVVSEEGSYIIYLSPNRQPTSIMKKARPLTELKLDSKSIDFITKALQKGLTLDELMSSLTPQVQSLSPIRFDAAEDELIEVLPSANSERVYIAGPAGSGKTWVAASYARNYKRLFPKNSIILFARQSDDPAFEGLRMEEIVMDKGEQEEKSKTLDDLVEDIKAIPLDDFANSLVIFDDCDNLLHKPLLKVIHALNNDLMCNGRKKNIHVIYISHVMLNAHQTKVVLNESQKVFFFPGTGSRGIRAFLKDYAGMEKKEIEQVLAINNSRWIMLARNNPRYIITEKSIFLI